MSLQGDVSSAQRVDNFLADEAITHALERMERKYFEEFKAAKTSEDRVRAQAKANLLDDFISELRVIHDRGDVAKNTIAAEEKRTTQSRTLL